MSVAKAQPGAYRRAGGTVRSQASHGNNSTHASSSYGRFSADVSKVDMILQHLQQTESHDWLGEVAHFCTQVCYLLLQNYNIARLNIYNYNCHLIVLTTLFFAQRIWFALWSLTSLSDAHGLRFACHIVLTLALLNSFYCGTQLVLRDSLAGGLYLVTPPLSSAIFYHVYLKTNANVFTAELFGLLSRCIYHSLETAYCIGVLPLKFLQYEHIYFDTSQCLSLTAFATVHVFLSHFCLEMQASGPEVVQQTRMLGEWRFSPMPQGLKANSPKPAEWSCHQLPYPRGAVVRCKDLYYEAVSTLNTCSPTTRSQWVYLITFFLGDTGRTKTLVLASLLVLNGALIFRVFWSSRWWLYAVMLGLNCGHFLYVKCRQLQGGLDLEVPQLKLFNLNGSQGCGRPCVQPGYRGGPCNGCYGGGNCNGVPSTEDAYAGDASDQWSEGAALGPGASPSFLPFMSAVSASTMLFFDPGGVQAAAAGGRQLSDASSSCSENGP